MSYHVAKSGLIHMMRYYAVKLGPMGIRVNAVSFGAVVKQESKAFYARNAALKSLCRTITPLGRMGTAKDIVQVVDFLCSSKAAFVTGQNIVVDGGLSLQWPGSLAQKIALRKDS